MLALVTVVEAWADRRESATAGGHWPASTEAVPAES